MRFVVDFCVRAVLVGVALAVVYVAFANNAHFWSVQMRADEDARKLAVGFSVLAGVLKLGIPVAIAFYRTSFWRRKELAFVFACALIFDIWSGFGYSQMTRDRASLETRGHDQARAKMSADIKELEGQRGRVDSDARRATVVRSEIAGAERSTRCATRVQNATDACKNIAELRTELASAEERERIEAQLAPLRAALAVVPPAQSAEPHVTVVASGLRSAGCSSCTDVALGYVWGALMLLIIEFAPSALCWFAARPPVIPGAPVDLEPPKRRTAAPSAPPAPRATAAPVQAVAAPAPARKPAAPGSANAGDVFALIAAARPDPDGWVKTVQRAMADKLGTSAAHVNRQLQALESQGVIEKKAGRTGTAVRIISKPKSASHLHAVA